MPSRLTITLAMQYEPTIYAHIFYGVIAGNRRQGRPLRRWTDDIKHRITGVPVAECVQRVRDRRMWRSIPGVRVGDHLSSDMRRDLGKTVKR